MIKLSGLLKAVRSKIANIVGNKRGGTPLVTDLKSGSYVPITPYKGTSGTGDIIKGDHPGLFLSTDGNMNKSNIAGVSAAVDRAYPNTSRPLDTTINGQKLLAQKPGQALQLAKLMPVDSNFSYDATTANRTLLQRALFPREGSSPYGGRAEQETFINGLGQLAPILGKHDSLRLNGSTPRGMVDKVLAHKPGTSEFSMHMDTLKNYLKGMKHEDAVMDMSIKPEHMDNETSQFYDSLQMGNKSQTAGSIAMHEIINSIITPGYRTNNKPAITKMTNAAQASGKPTLEDFLTHLQGNFKYDPSNVKNVDEKFRDIMAAPAPKPVVPSQ
jgi:hypothetical protein